MQKVMKPLADFTDMLLGVNRVTRLVLHIPKNDILVESESDTTLTADIKQHILVDLEAKYEESERSELLDVSSFLDPRFIADYLDEKGLETVKGRLVSEGAGFQGEKGNDGDRSNSERQQDEPPAKRRKLSTWLKESKWKITAGS